MLNSTLVGEVKMDYTEVISELEKFRDNRDWFKYHTLVNLSRALSIEASEVEKVFLWKDADQQLSDEDLDELKFELADVLTYTYYMCNKLDLDPNQIVLEKLAINENREWKFGGEGQGK